MIDLLIRLAIVIGIGLASLLFTRWIILPPLRRWIRRTENSWDDIFVGHRFFRSLSWVIPAIVVYYGTPIAIGPDALPSPAENPQILEYLPALKSVHDITRNLAQSGLVLSLMLALGALLTAVNTIYSQSEAAKTRAIKGYLQVIKLFLYIIGTITAVALAFDKDPGNWLTGVGAFTAVGMLIFKDTILSLVASIQLTQQDMLRVGDWIEMPQMGADGDVTDIALHSVKVQNWDKTITTIPTYKLISNSFKNWRGMQQSGGRRIKRCIHLDLSTVRFLTAEEIDRFERFDLLRDYIRSKKTKLAELNAEVSDPRILANSRQLTNIGTLRVYILAYLRRHPKVHRYMTLIVRQLQATEAGVPIEIYMFTNVTNWFDYESIQADIFDHIFAITPEFGLRLYQRPAGSDLVAVMGAMRDQ